MCTFIPQHVLYQPEEKLMGWDKMYFHTRFNAAVFGFEFAWVLKLSNWFLKFSESLFVLNIVVKSISLWGNNVWVFLFYHLADILMTLIFNSISCQFYIGGTISWTWTIGWLQDSIFCVCDFPPIYFMGILDRSKQVLLEKCHANLHVKSWKYILLI